MKGFPILLFSALTGVASAQTAAQQQAITQGAINEATIVSAYNNLQTAPSFAMTLSGTETLNGHQRSYTSYLWWSIGIDSASNMPTKAQVLLEDYDTSGGTPILENCYVGDGKTLWVYDTSRGTYSASFYSYYGAEPPAGYSGHDATRLLGNLYAVVKGQSAYLVRLLREINPGLESFTSVYETWAPRYLAWQPPTIPPVVDPIIPSRSYEDVGAEIYVLYNKFDYRDEPIANPTRSVAFQLDNSNPEFDPPIWNLTSIAFADEGVNRLTNFTIQVSSPGAAPVLPQTYPLIPRGGAFTPWPATWLVGYQPISPPKTLSD